MENPREPKQFVYHAKYGTGEHTAAPQFEIRGNQVFATKHNPRFSPFAQFEIRGNGEWHPTIHHPDFARAQAERPAGVAAEPWFRARSNAIHQTVGHPEGPRDRAAFEIRVHP